jgi:hypothetical protein
MMTTMKDDAKPGHRKLWHDLVERGIRAAIERGEPFEIENVLNRVGILHGPLYRTQALEYAKQNAPRANKKANPMRRRGCRRCSVITFYEDDTALLAHGHIMDFQEMMRRPAKELFDVMLAYQRRELAALLPAVIAWLQEMR